MWQTYCEVEPFSWQAVEEVGGIGRRGMILSTRGIGRGEWGSCSRMSTLSSGCALTIRYARYGR
jgi:hypothetical protein